MAAPAPEQDAATLDLERDFERLRVPARQRFLARARRAGQHAFHDLEEAADDAYQEAWVELARHPAAAVGDPVAYLAGVMWHRFHRRELRAARGVAVPLEEDIAVADAAPDDLAVERETLRATREALADVPERERAAVLLRSLGLGHRDVAASLGVSPRRARKLADAGHRRLTAGLDAAGTGARCARMTSTLRALGLGWPVSARRRERLQSHLSACPACRATIAALRHEGRLAALPVALAGRGRLDAIRSWLDGLWPGGQAEAGAGTAAGTIAGGTLVGKLAAGCVTVGLAGGCMAAVVATDDAPGDRPDRPARAEASPAPAAEARLRAATLRVAASDASERDRAARRPARATKTGRRARDAGRRAVDAGQRAREAGRQAVEAGRRARQASQQAVQAGQQARTAGQQARTAGQRAAQAGQQAAESGRQAGNAGRQAAGTGQRAAERIRSAADETREAVGALREALGR